MFPKKQSGFYKLCHGNFQPEANQSFYPWPLIPTCKQSQFYLYILLQEWTQGPEPHLSPWDATGHYQTSQARGMYIQGSGDAIEWLPHRAWQMAGESLMSGPSGTREMSHPWDGQVGLQHSKVAKSTCLGTSKSQLHTFFSNYSTSMYLSFLICTMGIEMVPNTWGCYEDKPSAENHACCAAVTMLAIITDLITPVLRTHPKT